MSKQSVIVGALWALGLGYFIFWACAPTTSMGPMAPRNGAEIGGGVSVTTNKFDGMDVLSAFNTDMPVSFDSQGWFEHRENVFSIGVVGFFGHTSLLGVGFFTRMTFVDNNNTSFGVELQAGGFWAALAFPTSFRLNDEARLTLNPSLGMRMVALQLPVGLALQTGDNTTLNLSAAAETRLPEAGGDRDWYLEPPLALRFGLGFGRTLD